MTDDEVKREARRQRDRRYWEKNRERILAERAENRLENIEAIRKASREGAARYRARNPEKVRESAARYRAQNPEKVREKQARWRSGGRDPNKPWPTKQVSYWGAHNRVLATFGPARNHLCRGDGCSAPAVSWSYNGNDPDEFSESRRDSRRDADRIMCWSGDPRFYDPLCHSCHTKRDRALAASRQAQR